MHAVVFRQHNRTALAQHRAAIDGQTRIRIDQHVTVAGVGFAVATFERDQALPFDRDVQVATSGDHRTGG